MTAPDLRLQGTLASKLACAPEEGAFSPPISWEARELRTGLVPAVEVMS
jgi:hypothetical protein